MLGEWFVVIPGAILPLRCRDAMEDRSYKILKNAMGKKTNRRVVSGGAGFFSLLS
jgi:hypothetical protein